MATTPADVQRKIRQLENDVVSIYDILRKIEKTQRRHGVQLTDLATGQAKSDARQARFEDRQAAFEDRQAALEDRQGALEGRQASLEAGQARLENRQTSLEAGQARLADGQTKLEAGFARLADRVHQYGAVLGDHGTKLDAILELLRTR